jgi:crossover junction endodeoxyribonuclease RuvC
MRILGLDPGSRHTGFGVVEHQGRRLAVRAAGRISPPKGADLPQRLAHLASELRRIIETEQPDFAVLEALFHGVNPRSLIVLAQARGALVATLGLAGLEIHEYSPAEVKTAVTGSGRAEKEQVGRMVRLLLGLGNRRMAADTTDALAVAICFSQRYRIDRLERLPRHLRRDT